MSAGERKTIPEDEVDLGWVVTGLRKLVFQPLTRLIKNWKTSLLLCAVGIAAAAGLQRLLPQTYRATFVIRPTDPSDKIYTRLLSELPALFKQKEHEVLAGLFSVPRAAIDQISSLKIAHSSYRVGADSSYYTEITVEGRDPKQFITAQNGVLNYLESNAYYQLIKTLQKKQIELSMEEIDHDRPTLDSLKRLQLNVIAKSDASGHSEIASALLNPAAVYTVSMDRIDRKSRLIAQSTFINRFQLVKPCITPLRPYFPPRILVLSLFTVPALLLVYLLVLFFLGVAHRQPGTTH